MVSAFIDMGLWDVVDILLVALLLLQIYLLIRKTVAIHIFLGIFLLYFLWFIVRALNLELLSSFLGQFFEFGVLALIVVFQPEIRKFFLILGTKYNLSERLPKGFFRFERKINMTEENAETISRACAHMSANDTGALIVIAHEADLSEYISSGVAMDSHISSSVLETIFYKSTPLHDGAVIIEGSKIKAARCILPVTAAKIKSNIGLRHRAAIGLSEQSDAHVITVSEENGYISYTQDGAMERDISRVRLKELLLTGGEGFQSKN
ncbi:uncharacterized protein (TIGR00159 family) [Balneicella halophila]|uniref:Diadenylate cyclase n=1 Tax=Balneicella halophila TaxID=1537566 RepID=A0A7L4UPR0_BALHA|nr:diadenylate cyclase CdaA [Balneicella halophila]PVX51746.1 uncharacterized protein (TIGR00159 family) [Balneicella halophila]